MEFFKKYEWKGNVRELDKIIKTIFFFRGDDENRDQIGLDDLPGGIIKPKRKKSASSRKRQKKSYAERLDETKDLMKKYNNNKTHVAKHLGVSWNTVDRRCKELGI